MKTKHNPMAALLHSPESYFTNEEESPKNELPAYLPERMRKLFTVLEEKFGRYDAETKQLRAAYVSVLDQRNALLALMAKLPDAGGDQLVRHLQAFGDTLEAIDQRHDEQMRLMQEVTEMGDKLTEERMEIDKLINASGGQA